MELERKLGVKGRTLTWERNGRRGRKRVKEERIREKKKRKGKRPMWVPCGKMESGKSIFIHECSTAASRVTWKWKVEPLVNCAVV